MNQLQMAFANVAGPTVDVVRSTRRRRTVSARVVDGVVRVYIPASMSVEEEYQWISEMLGRLERKSRSDAVDLRRRAATLARRHDMRTPASITWSDNQSSRWGSCTPGTGAIRISSRLAREPAWVLDYVIMHELAHLHVRGHNKSFWELVGRYPLAERARGFLIARGFEEAGLLDSTAGGPDGAPGESLGEGLDDDEQPLVGA